MAITGKRAHLLSKLADEELILWIHKTDQDNMRGIVGLSWRLDRDEVTDLLNNDMIRLASESADGPDDLAYAIISDTGLAELEAYRAAMPAFDLNRRNMIDHLYRIGAIYIDEDGYYQLSPKYRKAEPPTSASAPAKDRPKYLHLADWYFLADLLDNGPIAYYDCIGMRKNSAELLVINGFAILAPDRRPDGRAMLHISEYGRGVFNFFMDFYNAGPPEPYYMTTSTTEKYKEVIDDLATLGVLQRGKYGSIDSVLPTDFGRQVSTEVDQRRAKAKSEPVEDESESEPVDFSLNDFCMLADIVDFGYKNLNTMFRGEKNVITRLDIQYGLVVVPAESSKLDGRRDVIASVKGRKLVETFLEIYNKGPLAYSPLMIHGEVHTALKLLRRFGLVEINNRSALVVTSKGRDYVLNLNRQRAAFAAKLVDLTDDQRRMLEKLTTHYIMYDNANKRDRAILDQLANYGYAYFTNQNGKAAAATPTGRQVLISYKVLARSGDQTSGEKVDRQVEAVEDNAVAAHRRISEVEKHIEEIEKLVGALRRDLAQLRNDFDQHVNSTGGF